MEGQTLPTSLPLLTEGLRGEEEREDKKGYCSIIMLHL